MKLLLTTIAAVVLVGCGESQQSAPAPETKPEPTTAKAPDISINDAVEKGNIEAVKQHLTAGTDVEVKDGEGWTLLQMAAGEGHKEIAELLIAKGADVNAMNADGLTALFAAILGPHKEMAELLIAKGADVNAKGFFGMTPLNMANDEGEKEMADLLRKHGGKTAEELKGGGPVAEASQPKPPTAKTPDASLREAAMFGKIEAVKQHIAAGADVNAKDEWGTTPLHSAASEGHKEVVELLIEKGADVNAKDVDGDTPLDWATHPSNPNASAELANLLRKHGGKTGEELEAGN